MNNIKSTKFKNHNKAFTLIELAIVITVIGILAVGIVQGEKLLSAYKTAAVVSNFERYRIAVDEFKKQYMALPGDLGDASSIWSGVANGNEDSKINYASDNTEQFAAWSHLARSGLIKGSYSGTGSNTNYSVGVNIPSGAHASSGYRVYYINTDNTSGDNPPFRSNNFTKKIANALSYALFRNGCTSGCENQAILIPEEALSIDLKIDDGIPKNGNVISYGSGSTCNSGSTSTSTYTIATNNAACALYYFIE